MVDYSNLPAPVHGMALPPLLDKILELVPDEVEAERLRTVFEAGTTAMAALGELDLTPFEGDDEGQDDAYEVWDKLAPLVSHTLDTVHEVVTALDEQFEEPPAQEDPRITTSREIAAACRESLQATIVEFRDGSRKPENMVDRWRLLAYLSFARGKLRACIGDMIYSASNVFATTEKADVVPFYKDETDSALRLRRALGILRRDAHLDEGLPQDMHKMVTFARRLLPALQAFAHDEGYESLRVPDRRVFVETTARLERGLDTGASADELREHIDRFTAVMDSLAALNERETLVAHDRAIADTVFGCVSKAREALTAGLLRARIEVQSALGAIERLQGRDLDTDRFLEGILEERVEDLELEALNEHIQRLEKALSDIRGA